MPLQYIKIIDDHILDIIDEQKAIEEILDKLKYVDFFNAKYNNSQYDIGCISIKRNNKNIVIKLDNINNLRGLKKHPRKFIEKLHKIIKLYLIFK